MIDSGGSGWDVRRISWLTLLGRIETNNKMRAIAIHATRSTQLCIPPGSLNRVPASAAVKAGISPLSGGR